VRTAAGRGRSRRQSTLPGMSGACSHLDGITFIDIPDTLEGCEDCLASGGWWVHLRMCQSCGRIGCCDSSPSRHATAHAHATGHPVIRSAEPGEEWSYCYPDDVMFVIR
jgi:Zn-finger in ubiquitin-hydrolases and other protein